MKKSVKKILCICLGIVMIFATSIPSMAAETQNMENVLPESTELLPTQIGESKIVYQDENGTMRVTLVEVNESSNDLERALHHDTHRYYFDYLNNSGTKIGSFEVTLTCAWFRNGVNSYISNLGGSYSVISGPLSCSWAGGVTRETYASKYLNVYYLGGGKGFIFDVALAPLEQPFVNFGYGTYPL